MRMLWVAALIALSAPALAQTVEERTANLKASMEESYRQQKAYQAARSIERKAEAAKAAAAIRGRCERLGGVRIGLNSGGVLRSCWGKPASINTTKTAEHTREQWVYTGGYLYLTDGIVDAIQTSR